MINRQTADTFDAAATFFDLLREWGELDPEIAQKIKFAKWNAARILKAIREGHDPNESNPKLADETEGDELAGLEGLDPNDPDVKQLTSPGGPPAASVQEIPDAGEPLPSSSHQEQPYVQDGYFPPGHAAPPPSEPATIPSVPPEPPASASSQIPPQPSPQIPTKLPPQFAPPPLGTPSDVATTPGWAPPNAATAPPPFSPDPFPPAAPAAAPPPSIPVYAAPAPAPVPAPVAAPIATPPFVGTHKDLNKAQKHAKFAISALNFDDVPTAVQELRNALAALGTQ